MSLHNVDVAAALYREEPLALYYLSHDPAGVAPQLLDAHLTGAAQKAVTILSNAWHELNPTYLPIDEISPVAALFARRSPAALMRHPTLQADPPDAFYVEFSGDLPYWLLKGQRIGEFRYDVHSNSRWAQSCAEAYRWVHAYGVAAEVEFHRRFNRHTLMLPQLWTLEDPPPGLSAAPLTQPDPIVPADCLVLDSDGMYDTIESYRQYYRLHKTALYKWTRTTPPDWAREATPGP